MPKIISRKKALSKGLKRYFTGSACKYGHVDKRIVSNYNCCSCNKIIRKKYEALSKGRVVINRYQKSEKGKISIRKHNLSEKRIKSYKRYETSEKGIINRSKYRKSNEAKAIKRSYEKNRYAQDINFKLIRLMRARFKNFLKSSKIKKDTSIRKLLGCSPEFLKKFLEKKFTKKMNWKNHGSYWHIDHILPVSRFDPKNKNQMKSVWSYKNLQPLTIKENLKKSNNI